MERRMLWEKQIADEKNHKFTLQYFLLVHPVPKGENVYGVAIDKISGGQVLERRSGRLNSSRIIFPVDSSCWKMR